eukprot:TRINITY_DN21519_c0_g1_i1.p1 TRINITY_DN21519_c0_g1~~TRINITY_DN21519_c0_g1_i1.p1  ORF type:complete len:352 (+),score=40.58 TRINITY_DN21519_c0_g1_i1:47-1102(+)
MTALAQRLAKRILYKDDFIIAFDKWAGLTIQGDPKGQSLAAVLKQFKLRQDDDLSLVHRLDKGTSGVCIVARNKLVQQQLHKQFQANNVRKEYLALTVGVPYPPKGTIHGYIGTRPGQPQRLVYSKDGRGLTSSKVNATTHYELLSSLDTSAALVRLKPVTGRKHQLRIHCAQVLRCPVLGDTLYGPGSNAGIRQLLATKKGLLSARQVNKLPMMLHATSLELSNYASAMRGLESDLCQPKIDTKADSPTSDGASLLDVLSPEELQELMATNPIIAQDVADHTRRANRCLRNSSSKQRAGPVTLRLHSAMPSYMRAVMHRLRLSNQTVIQMARKQKRKQRFAHTPKLKNLN